MSSRINRNPSHIFDCFLEVVRPQENVSKPWIIQSYPSNYKDSSDERLKSVPQFTFPCYINVSQIQHFSFVLTSIEAQWTYGFVRYSPNSDTALCILSYLPWHELFFKMLNKCAELIQDSGKLELFLSSIYNSRLPVSGLKFHVSWGDSVFTGDTPNNLYLASIPENRNLTEYYNAVEINLMIALFASMLHERRIIMTCSKLSALSASVQAANTLIYPMFWQHIFIPVLPSHLMDYLTAPMPFLIGVPQTLFARTKMSELGDVVILDIDAKTFESPFNDVDNIPQEIIYNLRKALAPSKDHLGDTVSRAFLQALVHLIGGYREALKYRQGEKVSFSDDEFVKSRSSSVQPFLMEMLQLQIFRQFIEERLELLNSGKGFSDQFELECVSFSEDKFKKSKFNNVKREGAALAKAVKEKANPAMKQAAKAVKDGGKIAKFKVKASYKDAKSRFRDDKEEIRSDSAPHSAPSSPTARMRSSTINMASPNSSSFLTRNNTDLNFGRVLKYEKFDPPDRRDLSPEYEDIPKLDYVDLMSCVEEVMKRNKTESSGHAHSRIPPPTSISSSSTPIKKLSNSNINLSEVSEAVGDLINLETSEVVFDPLLDNQRFSQNPHKKLERTSNVQNGDVRKHSQGKYENYHPPGGSANKEFKEFLTSMTDIVNNQPNRVSDDVKLNEYGINFNAVSVARPINSNNTPSSVMTRQHGPPPVPPRSSNASFLHNSSAPYVSNNYSNNIPVNNRISSVGMYNNRDLFADLDPLGPVTPNRQGEVIMESSSSHLPPPVVPPRTKKQWTTFD